MSEPQTPLVSRAGRALAIACLALALGGCCALSPWRCGEPGALRVAVPEPYLLVRAAGGDGAALDYEIVYLPHPGREMLVRPGPWAGEDYQVELAEGGFLAGLSGQSQVRLRPRVTLPAKPDNRLPDPEPLGAGPPRPGLYKLVWRGDPVPDLVPVAYFDDFHAEPPLPVQAVVDYRPAAGQPEIIEEILIQLDGGDPEAIAPHVRVYRGEVEVTGECDVKPRGDAIAIRLPDARGSFAPYRVVIEPLDVEAPLPSKKDLDELRPRARISALDGPRRRRFAIDYDSGRGSPISLERTLETVRLGEHGPDSGLFQISAPAPTRHLLEVTGDPPDGALLSVTPVNLTGLTGETVTTTLPLEPPTPPPPAEPTAADASLTLEGPFEDELVFRLEIDDPDRRVDLERTERENHIPIPWSRVECTRLQGRVTCGGKFSVLGPVPEFTVFCLGRPESACLTAEVSVQR